MYFLALLLWRLPFKEEDFVDEAIPLTMSGWVAAPQGGATHKQYPSLVLSSTRSVNTALCLLFSQFREFLLQYGTKL
jgi:hypothetical protein